MSDHVPELEPSMSSADMAYAILSSRGQPVHYQELIDQILAVKKFEGENKARIIAKIHTEINLDSRFVHMGQGVWGLRKWAPRAGDSGRVVTLLPSGRARRDYDDDEEEAEERYADLEGEEPEEEAEAEDDWDSVP